MVRGRADIRRGVAGQLHAVSWTTGYFVAHNVNFDYGFISHEYETARSSLPVSEAMHRRRNAVGATPDTKSYGLGKLCDLYGIELETHHRALWRCEGRQAAC